MRRFALLLLALTAVATPCLAIDCKDQTFAQQADQMTNQHRTLTQMSGVMTIQWALKENVRIITKTRGYRRIAPMAQSVDISRGALKYAESLCLPITQAEADALATMFLGVYAATDNADDATISNVMNRYHRTDEEKIKSKAFWRGVRIGAAAAIGKALGELATTKVGGKVVNAIRGGWKGAIIGTLLTPSEIGPGDVLVGPGSQPSSPERSPTREGLPDSIHEGRGSINDAPRETIDRASTTAYVAIDPTIREQNNQWIVDARAAIKAKKH